MHTRRIAFLWTTVLIALAAGAPSAAAAPQEPARESVDEVRVRASAREVIRLENENSRRSARIERLIQIYRSRGQADRVTRLEDLRARGVAAHRVALARHEQELGPGRYERLRNSMRGQLAARAQAQQQARERAAAASREPTSRTDARPRERREGARAAQRPPPRPSSRGGGRP